MLQEMRLRNVYEHFMRPLVPLVASLTLALAWSACTPGDGGMNDAIISGGVEGQDGPEAGVWVIAETDALGTGFVKIVVTDDDGRFVLPQLPDASYDVWVRGYGLADSEPVAAQAGDDLVLAAAYPETPQEEAVVYPANYWYSLLEVPPASCVPGHRSRRGTASARTSGRRRNGSTASSRAASSVTSSATRSHGRSPTSTAASPLQQRRGIVGSTSASGVPK